MKNLVVIVLALIATTGSLFAQEQTAEENASKTLEMWTKVLTLDDTQQSSSHALLIDFNKSAEVVQTDESLSEEEKGEKIESLTAELDGKVIEVLTEDQKVIYQEQIVGKRQKMIKLK